MILDFKLLLASREGFAMSTSIYLNRAVYMPKTPPILLRATLETLVAHLKYLSQKNTLTVNSLDSHLGSNNENDVSFYLAFSSIYFIFIYFKCAHVIIMTSLMLLQVV